MKVETEDSIRQEYAEMLEEARKGGNYEQEARYAFNLYRTKLMLFKEANDPTYKRPKEWYE